MMKKAVKYEIKHGHRLYHIDNCRLNFKSVGYYKTLEGQTIHHYRCQCCEYSFGKGQ